MSQLHSPSASDIGAKAARSPPEDPSATGPLCLEASNMRGAEGSREPVEAPYFQALTPKTSGPSTEAAEGKSDLSVTTRDPKPDAKPPMPNELAPEEGAIHVDDPLANTPSFIRIFSYADELDIFLMAVGSVGAVLMGLVQPAMTVVLGQLFDSLNGTNDEFMDEVLKQVQYLCIFAAVALVSGFLQAFCWNTTAERQTRKLRKHYVAAILRQEIGWFDFKNSGDLVSGVVEKTTAIQEGIGRKFADGIQHSSMFIGGYALGFSKSWELTLVIISVLPVLGFTAWNLVRSSGKAQSMTQEAYARAAAVASEVLSSIRTVVAFGGQKREVQRYAENLKDAERGGIKKSVALGIANGLFFFFSFAAYALGMWYGGQVVADDIRRGCFIGTSDSSCVTGGVVVGVFFSVILASIALGQAAPSFMAVAGAGAAAAPIFDLLDRTPHIDAMSDEGHKLTTVRGEVEFRNVTFAYPTRPQAPVCRGYNLKVGAGETVALVGHSGSGKSTAVALLERFYDPQEGAVYLDGMDLRTLNVRWLRQQIGLVSQEPVLFGGTIAENIANGKPGCTMAEIESAAKLANAYEFIQSFPKRFETEVGEKGIQLSGGQKQRVAIARAIIKNPAILVLDEATSALDNESERIVQASLDSLLEKHKRTTIIIAHRLSTIRYANKIAVFEAGRLVEEGKHEDLIAIEDGHYRRLVDRQKEEVKDEDDECHRRSSLWGSQVLLDERREAGSSTLYPGRDATLVSSSTSVFQSNAGITLDLETGAKKEELYKVPAKRLYSLGSNNFPFLGLGLVGALMNGAVFPLWGLFIAKMIASFFGVDAEKVEEDTVFYGLMFVAVGTGALVGNMAQYYGFGVAGEKVTRAVREQTFKAILRKEIEWFDMPNHDSGTVCQRLAEDCTLIQSQTGESIARHVANLFSLILALCISFFYSWEMSLIMLAVFPLLAFTGVVEYARVKQNEGNLKQGTASVISEGINNIRTVAAFDLEETIINRYAEGLYANRKVARRQAIGLGLAFGASQMLVLGVLALVFWYGSKLYTLPDTSPRKISFQALLVAVVVILLSAYGFGNAAQDMTDSSKARVAISNVFSLIDSDPKIDSESEKGKILQKVAGEVSFNEVRFSYPSRPNVPVCRGYTFKVAAGQTVALVGASGSGKSTAVNLLERFYDPRSGSISLDGVPLPDINVSWLRSQIGLVGQEPVLFSGSISENISYGKPDATMDEIIAAAKMANAHSFICNLPDQYETLVGEKGVQLSGGQKQRIAIARAIIRDPAILLLDEATSALDTESEAIVQKALDDLLQMKKRTTLIIAHRLSTIKNADRIYYIERGKVREEGTHDQLVALNGKYAKLVSNMK